jgi:hypothetical protein
MYEPEAAEDGGKMEVAEKAPTRHVIAKGRRVARYTLSRLDRNTIMTFALYLLIVAPDSFQT